MQHQQQQQQQQQAAQQQSQQHLHTDAESSPPQQFCLRWNNYQTNLTNVFDQLLQSESFVDVTLACDGHSIKAHKMVLSACSPYFQALFFDNPCQHPIVIMRDIKWPELKAAVEFMYKGEINVSQEQIGPLLKVAETLKIRGLADVNGDQDVTAAPADTPSTDLLPNNNNNNSNSKTDSNGGDASNNSGGAGGSSSGGGGGSGTSGNSGGSGGSAGSNGGGGNGAGGGSGSSKRTPPPASSTGSQNSTTTTTTPTTHSHHHHHHHPHHNLASIGVAGGGNSALADWDITASISHLTHNSNEHHHLPQQPPVPRAKKRRRHSGERSSSLSSLAESSGGGGGNGVVDDTHVSLDMSPVAAVSVSTPIPPPSLASEPLSLTLPFGQTSQSHHQHHHHHSHHQHQQQHHSAGLGLLGAQDDMEIKPGIAEMIREEERAKLLESSHAWLGASTSSIADYSTLSMKSLLKLKTPLWTQDQLREAIDSVVKQKLRFTTASSKYGIPKGTLYDNILGKSNRMAVLDEAGLTATEEASVLEYCCDVSVSPYNRRTKKSLHAILEYVEKLRRNRDPEFLFTGLSGFRWWWAFCKKHTIVSLYYESNNTSKHSKDNKSNK